MRQLFADFNSLQERPGLGLSVMLGAEDRHPELVDLQPNEPVLLVEPGNLYAEGVARFIEKGDDFLWWYGVITSRDAIHDLASGQTSPAI